MDTENGGESAEHTVANRVLVKVGRIPLNSLRCMKSLMPRASTQFLQTSFKLFSDGVKDD